MNLIHLISIVGMMFLLAFLFRNKLIELLHVLRGRLHVQSLREAIHNADKDKEQTGRKNMVVFNTANAEFEPVQKRLLKFLAAKNKQKNNGKRTDGRKKFTKPVKKRVLTGEKVKQVEKNSLYVTN